MPDIRPTQGFTALIQSSSVFIRFLLASAWFLFAGTHLLLSGQDNQPPVFTVLPKDSSVLCSAGSDPIPALTDWYNNAAGAMAMDDSGQVTITASPSLSDVINIFNQSADTLCGNTRSVRVVFTASDAAGNLSMPVTARFFTFDNIPPTLIIPPNVQYKCVAGIRDTLIAWIRNKGHYTATDNCSNTLNWTIYQYSISAGGNVIQTGGGSIANGPYPNIPNGVCAWTMNINFFVLDECGNQIITPGTTTFSVMDDVPPVLMNVPGDVTVSCDSVPLVPNITATDFCTQNMTVQFSQNSTRSTDTLNCAFYNYEIIRTWSATDNCNNTSTATQRITVRDLRAPVIQAPSNINLSCAVLAAKPDSLFITGISDNCSPYTLSFSDSTETVSCSYRIFRKYTARDVCQNVSEFLQTLRIDSDRKPDLTSAAQDRSYLCENTVDLETEFSQWLNAGANSAAVPVCTQRLKLFAAVPGSYNVADTLTFPGIHPGTLNAGLCPSGRQGFLRYETVDFVYYDECGNVSVSTATFGVRDTLAPALQNCPEDRLIALSQDDCKAQVSLIAPFGTDNCIETQSPLVRNAVHQVRSASPGNPESIVDSFTLVLGPYNPNAFVIAGDAELIIELRNLDIDDNPEYFNIIDEDGMVISRTPNGTTQCSNATLTLTIQKSRMERWMQDGRIEFRFIPNIVPDIPILSVNDICANSQVRARLSFEIEIRDNLSYRYKINNGDFRSFQASQSLDFSFEAGRHNLSFEVSDCAGNTKSCITQIEVVDNTGPVLTCPADTVLVLPQDSCRSMFTLLTNFQVTENCSGNRMYARQVPATKEASLISYIFNDLTGSFVARPRQFIFTDVFPVRYLNKDIILEFEIFGDVGDPDEHYEIFAPDGSYIGNTVYHQQTVSCGLSVTRFALERNRFNDWIQNGNVTFTAIPRVGTSIQGGGINPCRPLSPGQITDGESYIQARLKYTDLSFTLEISGATTQVQTAIPANAAQVNFLLNGGLNTLKIASSDQAGNMGSCTFTVEVEDRQAPQALCKNAVIQISPSGIDSYILQPSEIDNGSRDNCVIAERTVEPRLIDCSMAGNVNVQLTVTDAAGNSAQCSTQILVRTMELRPTFTSGLCQNDTLKLFANPPASSVPNIYSYRWTGPNGVEFFEENPFIPNVTSDFNGTYRVTVTGFNGCTAEGSVLVNIQPLINPVIQVEKDTICEGNDIILSTTAFSGEVTYEWYEGIFPNGVLLQKTQTPNVVLSPVQGVHFYHVIAQGEGCRSNPSAFIRLTVLRVPVATVNNLLLTPCEGQSIQLGTSVTGNGFSYQWTGPAGYSETGQNPRIINNAQSIHSGIYKLVITNRRCSSDTASTTVTVLEKPARPLIAGAEVFCQGSTFNLLATNSPGADSYEWYKDNVLFRVTAQNTITVTNAQIALQGAWQVVAVRGSCRSDISEIRNIGIINILEIGATNSGPACEGDSIRLTATFVPNASYIWSGPVANIPPVQNPLIPAVPGEYSVTITTPTLCQNNASTFVQVTGKPTITAVSTDARPCMDGNTPVRFFPSVFPPEGNYSYEWSYANTVFSTQKNPVLENASLQDTGKYILRIFNQGCPSDPFEIKLLFRLSPPRPELQSNFFYCTGDTIRINTAGQVAGDQFLWATPGGAVSTMESRLLISGAGQIHNGQYSLTVVRDGCPSLPSEPLTIDVRPRPVSPAIIAMDSICHGSDLALSTAEVQNALYIWTGPGGFVSDFRNPVIPAATSQNSGVYTLQTEVNGCRSLNPQSRFIFVRDRIETPMVAGNNFSICKDDDSRIEICLEPNTLTAGALVQFYHALSGEVLSESREICHVIRSDAFAETGTHLFYAVAAIGSCLSERSQNYVIRVSVPPDIEASFVDDRITVCPGDFITLISRFGPPDVELTFTSPDPQLILQPNTDRSVLISNLKEGSNFFLLHYSVPGCLNFSTDTAVVHVEFIPDLKDDIYTIPYNRQVDLNILDNDKVPNGFEITVTSPPKHGRVVVRQNFVTYIPDPRFTEDVSFTYKVCGIFCDNLCAEARVVLSISDALDCFAPNVITPNKDGYNDAFVVPCLNNDNFPRNQLYVFNQWGAQVFHAAPYRNDWEGTHAGNPLPAGTYYYILELGDGSNPIHGFLILQR